MSKLLQVVRRVVEEYRRRRRSERIARLYRQGYGRHPPTEFKGWEKEQAWPED